MDYLVSILSSISQNGKYSFIYFLIFASLIFIWSKMLVKNAEIIMARTKFGSGFVAGVLIATVTSFPELITEITQGINGTPEIGLADDVGSNAFSSFMIFVASIIFFKKGFTSKIDYWSKITIAFSFLLATVLLIFVYLNVDLLIGVKGKLAFGIVSFLFFIAYVFYLIFQYKYGTQEENQIKNEKNLNQKTTQKIWKVVAMFIFWALLLIISSIMMNVSALSIQKYYKVSSNTIGGLFLSISTSLPEIVAFLILIKKNKPIAAISSLVGSHIFNLSAIFFGDLAFTSNATFNHSNIGDSIKITLLCFVTTFLLLINVVTSSKIKKEYNYLKLVIPILGILTYVIGWILLLTL